MMQALTKTSVCKPVSDEVRMDWQIARSVKDALREAQELARPGGGQEGGVPDPDEAEGPITPEALDGPQSSRAAGSEEAAGHQSVSNGDSAAAGGSADVASADASGNADAGELVVFQVEQLSAAELAIARLTEQVLCCQVAQSWKMHCRLL